MNIRVPGGSFTQPLAVNDTGSIVGVFGGPSGTKGFLVNASGYSALTGPAGSIQSQAIEVDNGGDIAGWYINTASVTQGCLLNATTGTYTTIAVPGASATEITRINSAGGIVAGVADLSTGEGGFLYDYGSSSPQYFSFNLPVALSINSMSINDVGEIASTYADTNGLTHGCL